MSTPLSIYMYPETTGWVSGIEQVTLHYVAGVHGLESISPISHNITLDTPTNSASGIFETLEEGLQYYLITAGPTIEAAVNLATTGDYEFVGEMRFAPQDDAQIEYRLAGIDSVSAAVTAVSTAYDDDIEALNLALSEVAQENTDREAATQTKFGLIDTAFDTKVDKISGKGLSTEDYSTAEKSKLSGIAASATNTAAPVNADWNSSSGLSQIQNKPTIPSTTRTTSTLSLSLVGTGATGSQISSTKDSSVKLNVSTSTTSTIGGPSTSLVALKICSTNSATEGNWTTVSTLENDQTITLAIVLNSIQVMKGQLCADVPANWYVKLVNSGTGTHSEAFITGQQTIYG